MFSSFILVWLSVAAVWAQDAPVSEQTIRMEQGDEELVVYGDLFARWDGTRWFIETESALPYAIQFAADDNLEFPTVGYQARAVIACEKDWKLGKLRYEVNCTMEDFGLQATSGLGTRRDNAQETAQKVLDELDAKLTGATIQLQVLADGRVDNIDIEGVPKTNRRISQIHETLRILVGRMMSGFHLKLRKMNQLHEGKWVEFNSTVLSMPPTSGTTPSHSSHTVHYLNRFEGNTLVQSIGRGMVSVPPRMEGLREGSHTSIYQTDLIGVSIFDYEEGFMLERVWAVEGEATASSFFSQPPYWFAGRIRMLGEEEQAEVGPTQLISARGQQGSSLPPWVPIER